VHIVRANTDKSHVLLVGPPGAVAEARSHDFRWGSAPLLVVDQVRYLGVRLNCAWTWETHIATAYRKGLGAFHTWRPVLVSTRISVAAKLRIIHSVIRSVLQYGMEVWGPLAHLVAGTRRRGGSNRLPPLLHFDQLLLSAYACRLACGVRALPGEPGWTRRACVSPEVLLSVWQVLPSECACDLAHLRYSERLRAASRQPHSQTSLHFRAAARAAMASDHFWLLRVLRSSQQLPGPLPPATLANRSLRDHLLSQTSSAWEAALAPYPAAENVSARGRRRGPGPPAHINPLGRSLDMCSPLPILHSGADVVFPFLCVLSGKFPFCHSVTWDSVPVHGLCPRPNRLARLGGTR
jgi:hypothetical protein